MTEDVLLIIENVSFSKEDKQRQGLLPVPKIDPYLTPFLDAIRDADRIQAIG